MSDKLAVLTSKQWGGLFWSFRIALGFSDLESNIHELAHSFYYCVLDEDQRNEWENFIKTNGYPDYAAFDPDYGFAYRLTALIRNPKEIKPEQQKLIELLGIPREIIIQAQKLTREILSDINSAAIGATVKERKTPGGIDFRSLPIVTQAIVNLSANINNVSLSRLSAFDLDNEWRQIQNLVNSGIIPSAERIKEYVRASCAKDTLDSDIQKVIQCISEILRAEEERCCATEAELKDILVVLESANSSQDLKIVFLGKVI